MPKFSHTTTDANQIAASNALDDVLYWQQKLDNAKTRNQRDYYRGKVYTAQQLHKQAQQNCKTLNTAK